MTTEGVCPRDENAGIERRVAQLERDVRREVGWQFFGAVRFPRSSAQ